MKYSVTTDLTSWNVTGNDPEATLRLEVIGAYPIQFTVGSVTRDVKPFEYWDVAMRPYTVRAKGIGGSSSFRTFKQVGDAIDESDINGAVGDVAVSLDTLNSKTEHLVNLGDSTEFSGGFTSTGMGVINDNGSMMILKGDGIYDISDKTILSIAYPYDVYGFVLGSESAASMVRGNPIYQYSRLITCGYDDEDRGNNSLVVKTSLGNFNVGTTNTEGKGITFPNGQTISVYTSEGRPALRMKRVEIETLSSINAPKFINGIYVGSNGVQSIVNDGSTITNYIFGTATGYEPDAAGRSHYFRFFITGYPKPVTLSFTFDESGNPTPVWSTYVPI